MSQSKKKSRPTSIVGKTAKKKTNFGCTKIGEKAHTKVKRGKVKNKQLIMWVIGLCAVLGSSKQTVATIRHGTTLANARIKLKTESANIISLLGFDRLIFDRKMGCMR